MASIYQRGRTWWISYYSSGQLVQRSLKTKDKTVAKFKKNEIENKLALGDSPLPQKDMSARQCFDEFKLFRGGRIDQNHQNTGNYRIQRFFDDAKINSLKAITETSLKAHLDQRINIEGGISNRTANHTITQIKTFLNFCVKRHYLHENPIKDMPRYPINQKEPRFLSALEVRRLLFASEGSQIYTLIATAVYTGMRYGELKRLEWQDVDFGNNVITVNISKSKKFRKIPIHSDLRPILSRVKGSGKCFNVTAFDWYFKKARKASGLPHFRFHDLRHTFASLLIKSGVDILTVSKLLGHSSVMVTQIYSHLYQDHIKDAIGKLKI